MQTACGIKLVELRYHSLLSFCCMMKLEVDEQEPVLGLACSLLRHRRLYLPASATPLRWTKLSSLQSWSRFFLKLDLSSTWSRLFSHNSPLLVVLPSSKASPPIPKLPPTCQRSCWQPCCRARCLSSSSSSHVSSLHSSSGHCHLNVAPCGYFSWISKEEKEDCEWD